MVKRLILFALTVFAIGCAQTQPNGACKNLATGETHPARYWQDHGAWTGKDGNGVFFRVNSNNSERWECRIGGA